MSKIIAETGFIPISLEKDKYSLRLIRAEFPENVSNPLVIILTHKNVEFPSTNHILTIKVIKLPKNRIPDGPEYAEFKRTVLNHFAKRSHENSLIGIASTKGDDICLYLAARWIIEERCKLVETVLSDLSAQFPPGITKEKYLRSLEEIYDTKLINDEAIINDIIAAPSPVIPEMSGVGIPSAIPGNETPDYDEIIQTPMFETPFNMNSPMQPIGFPMVPSASSNEDLIFAQFNETSLKYQSIDDCDDPIIMAVGQSVDIGLSKKLTTEIEQDLRLSRGSFLIQPFINFNRTVVQDIRIDPNCYWFREQPEGKRCLLFARGKSTYLICDDFIRSIKCFIPDHTNDTQCIVYSLFEGVLYRKANSNEIKFVLTDCYINETQNITSLPFKHRYQYVKIVMDDITAAIDNGNTYLMENDVMLEMREYYLLRNFELMVKKKSSSMKGFVFTQSRGVIERSSIFYYYQEDIGPIVTVILEIEANKFYGVLSDGIKVFFFNNPTEQLRNYQEKNFDIEFDFLLGIWRVRCLSKKQDATNAIKFKEIMSSLNLGPFTEQELCSEVKSIVQCAQYSEEY